MHAIQDLLLLVEGFHSSVLDGSGGIAQAQPECEAQSLDAEARQECILAETLLSKAQKEYKALRELDSKERKSESSTGCKDEQMHGYWAMKDARVNMFQMGMLADIEDTIKRLKGLNHKVNASVDLIEASQLNRNV